MKAALIVLSLISFISFSSVSSAATNSNTNDPATAQARQDYRAYLEKLKELSQQYSQITGQMKEVIKEEGVPTIDENTGQIIITHDLNFSGSAPIQETETEIRIVLEKPGLRKNSIHVTIENNRVLRIDAVKKAVQAGQQEERFEEAYDLPSFVRDNNTHAKYEDGILTVTLQKIQTSKKTVPVTVQ